MQMSRKLLHINLHKHFNKLQHSQVWELVFREEKFLF